MTATQSSRAHTVDPCDASIHFPEGLVGCDTWKEFVLLVDDDVQLPIGVLQCLDEPGVALMVIDPELIVPGYAVALSADDRKTLALATDERPTVYCTLTTTSDGAITANLVGPLAINPKTRQAKQLVLSDTGYSARHPVVNATRVPCSS
jgi:flagellar assembly factor FliW